MTSRLKAGKAFVTCNDDETINAPSPVAGVVGTTVMAAATHVACVSTGGRILTFTVDQGKARGETLEIRSLNNAMTARARKGKAADLGFKPASVTRVL